MGSVSIDLGDVGDSWPLIRYVLDDPVYHDVYVTYIAEALETVFEPNTLETLIRETYGAIAPYFLDEEGKLSAESYLSSVDEAEAAMEQVILVARDRAEDAAAYLIEEEYEPAALVISEIHYNPSPEQGGDSTYEFVEIYNRGNITVDLTGCRLDEGVECSFPGGLELEAGTCLIVAADASAYDHLDCQVVEWESGRLANEGEAVRLVDSTGYWIDRVVYDDRSLWPTDADGEGCSLELTDTNLPNHLPGSWAASATVGGTPGEIPNDG